MKKIYTEIYLRVFILTAILSAVAVAQNKPSDLGSAKWNLIEINGKKLNASKAFIEFDENEMQITGNAGCNRMFGKYERKGTNIKFSGIGTTKKFCAENGLMKIEADFINALGKTISFERKGDSLSFLAANRLVLKFNKTSEANSAVNLPVKIEDKKWILETVGDAEISESDVFLVFDKANRSAGGNGGCNSFGGNYSASRAKIKFTKILSTMRACPEDDKMKTEKEFLNGLQKADNFLVKNEKLHLYVGKKLLLTFFAVNK